MGNLQDNHAWPTTKPYSSVLSSFNDEKTCVEFWLTRVFPTSKLRRLTAILGLMRGVNSDWVYEQLEAAADGVVEFKVEEEGRTSKDMMRIRSMRNVHFVREWRELKIEENFEVTLGK